MEDAAVHIISMQDGNSLFAVFDGHGGTAITTQDMKSANMSATSLLHNSRPSRPIKTKITFRLWRKLLSA